MKKEKIKEFLQRDFFWLETMQVLKSPLTVYWTWGVSHHLALEPDADGYTKALLLKVDGHHHKDFVLITLGWNDTYTVRLLDKDYNELKKFDNIYFDSLQSTIDKEIEFIQGYNF